MRIYQAGPLFSEAEREWHKSLKARLLTAGHEVIWPGDLITQEEIAEWGDEAPARILQRDLEGIISCKAVVALLDGPQVDDGTAFEIGYMTASNKPAILVTVGDRNEHPVNLMLSYGAVSNVDLETEGFEALEKFDFTNIAMKKWVGSIL